jgi:hypothetical protein
MKKRIFIFLIVLGLFVFNITQASAGCNIVWTGSLSGSVPTQETSRTPQAVQELYNTLVYMGDCYEYAYFGEYGYPPASFNNNCYGFDFYGNRSQFTKWVCADGTWTINCEYYCGPFAGYCGYNDAGNWDVVCNDITTSIIPTTTTTIQQTTTTTTAPATLINLSSFTATPKSGKVILQWQTESETDNAGFNIYRATAENGDYIKINSALIAAEGSTTQGASYEYIDNGLKNGKTYYYKLEDIDLNGGSTFHGPVKSVPRWLFAIFK